MTVITKPATRFVPTLTEVVRPGSVNPATVLDRTALVEQVLQAVAPRLEQQLRTALYALVEEQLCKAPSQWQKDVETAVTAAVEQALAKRTPTGI